MTIRSKQWYTKTSRLSNSFANNSIGRLRVLLQQQDHRSGGRWSQTHWRPGERRCIAGENRVRWRELADGRARLPERTRGARPVSAGLLQTRPIVVQIAGSSYADPAVFA